MGLSSYSCNYLGGKGDGWVPLGYPLMAGCSERWKEEGSGG